MHWPLDTEFGDDSVTVLAPAVEYFVVKVGPDPLDGVPPGADQL